VSETESEAPTSEAVADAPQGQFRTPEALAQSALDLALLQLPAYVSAVVERLTRAITSGGREGAPRDELVAEGLERLFRIDPDDRNRLAIIRGTYGRWLTKLPMLKQDITLDSLAREAELRAEGLHGDGAYHLPAPPPLPAETQATSEDEAPAEDPATRPGIHILPLRFTELDTRTRLTVLFHEMGRFYFNLEVFDPRPVRDPMLVITRCGVAYSWFAAQLCVGRRRPM